MATPIQGLIVCKTCGTEAPPHVRLKVHCDPCARKIQVEYQKQYRERLKAKPKTIVCKGCGKQFTTTRGRTWRCHDCTLVYQREYADKDRKRHADYSRKYRAGLGDEYRERQVHRRADKIAAMSPEELEEFRQFERDKTRRIMAKLKAEIFEAYGGPICACCGETQEMFLSVDHINNDGYKMKRLGIHPKNGTGFYQWLRKNNFPPGFQILCFNCNQGKRVNGGVCPHQSDKV